MADELEVRVTVTRKSSTEHSGSDYNIATVASTMNSADRVRFLGFLVSTYGMDAEGNPRDQQQIIEAYWDAISAGTVANIERWEQELAAAAARNEVRPITVTRGV